MVPQAPSSTRIRSSSARLICAASAATALLRSEPPREARAVARDSLGVFVLVAKLSSNHSRCSKAYLTTGYRARGASAARYRATRLAGDAASAAGAAAGPQLRQAGRPDRHRGDPGGL